VTFFGDFIDDMQFKCKIITSDDSEILVDLETLNFIENPDIALNLQTSAHICKKQQHNNIADGTHFTSKGTFTIARRNDESSYSFTSPTISKAYYYGKGRRSSTSSCVLEMTFIRSSTMSFTTLILCRIVLKCMI
jgi:hypothetical protein